MEKTFVFLKSMEFAVMIVGNLDLFIVCELSIYKIIKMMMKREKYIVGIYID